MVRHCICFIAHTTGQPRLSVLKQHIHDLKVSMGQKPKDGFAGSVLGITQAVCQ